LHRLAQARASILSIIITHKALFILQIILHAARKGQLINTLVLLRLVLVDRSQRLADAQARHTHQTDRPRLQAGQVAHRDLAVAPDGAYYDVHLLTPEPGVRDAHVGALDDERQGSLLHVQHHDKLVRHLEGFIRRQAGWISDSRLVTAVMIRLVPPQVPAPGLIIVANQGLIPHTM
jgi:hypothetical protein